MNETSPQREIDDLIASFFGSFDNRFGRVPTEEAITSLFVPQAIVLQDRGDEISTCTVEEFVRPRVQLLKSGALVNFHEWETAATTTLHGKFAVRISSYEKLGELEGRPYSGSGTKVLQLAEIDRRWRVAALSWHDRTL